MLSKEVFVRFVDMFGVTAAILNVCKFGLQRDRAALLTISTIAAVSLAVFALYLTFVVPRLGSLGLGALKMD